MKSHASHLLPTNYQGPGIYRHFKGSHYYVLGIAEQTESTERLVVYQLVGQPLGASPMHARPLKMFNEVVRMTGVLEDKDRRWDVQRFVRICPAEWR